MEKIKKAVATSTGGEILTELGPDNEMKDRTLDRLFKMCLFIDLSDAPAHRKNVQDQYAKKFKQDTKKN